MEKMNRGYRCMFLGILVLISGCQICWSQDFGYYGEKGPSHWGEQYNECTGKHQSPINIDLLHVKRIVLPTLKMNAFDVSGNQTTLKNNGHTVMITMDSKTKPTISGGPLNGDYEFAQLHFHWGDNDTVGSEHLSLRNRSFPMELHMVFYNKQYLDAHNAMKYSDGLCVLAFFYDVDDKNNENYNEFSDVLSHVVHPETSAAFKRPPSLFELMPKDLAHYFTYNGSLTTPPCSEIVTWIDFQQPIMLSHNQIQMFRDLLDEEGHVLTHNFRPIQPLGDRVILFNIIDNDDNTLDHDDDVDDNIPPSLDDQNNNDLSDSTDVLGKDDNNVLNDLPDNSLDDSEIENNSNSDNSSMVHFVSLYTLMLTILISSICSR